MDLPSIRNVVARIGVYLKNKFAAVIAGIDANGLVRVLRTDANGALQVTAVTAATPTVYTIAVPLKDTEHTQVLPVGTKQFSVQVRLPKELRIAFVTGKVAGPVEPYGTVKLGTAYNAENLNLTAAITLYFATKDDAQVVEIIAWS